MSTSAHDPTRTDRPTPRRRLLLLAGAVLAAWTALGLLIAQQTWLQLGLRGETRPLWSVVAPPLVACWLWALYTPAVVWATRRLRPLRARGVRGWLAFGAGHLTLATTLMVLGVTMYTLVRPLIDGHVVSWWAVFSTALLMDSTAYLAVAALTEAAAYAALYRERDRMAQALARAATELEARLDEARLRTLEAQLRPHFLYNTLNVIAELVHDSPERADEMLTMLGRLLRRTYVQGPHLVPLAEELELVRAYARILGHRYQRRVEVNVDVPPELEEHPVPTFSLQPLVENAFRHGVDRREGRTEVTVTGAREGDALVLRVRDRGLDGHDGPGARARWRRRPLAAAHRAGEGVGLRNTRDRLTALFGPGAAIALERTGPDETTATMRVPSPRPARAPAVVAPTDASPAAAPAGVP